MLWPKKRVNGSYCSGFRFRDITPILGNQMAKKLENGIDNEMESGFV